jgi:EAL domain-containing protein (putative c-di-GMP-specific phosphodiesterase class I)
VSCRSPPYQIPPQLLDIEITETAAMKDVQKAAAVLRELRSLGLKIAIDDFGTGYSSLGYLKNLPVDASSWIGRSCTVCRRMTTMWP